MLLAEKGEEQWDGSGGNGVTTILARSIDGKQIGDLYERRWDGEVDIRSIKSTMRMDIPRCKTPDMVHKESWTHLLAYNLLSNGPSR